MSLQVSHYESIWIAGVNRGDVSPADVAFAPNCVFHMEGAPEPNLSVAGFKEMIAGMLTAFPDLKVTVDDQIVSGDKVATRWSAVGTHTGPLGETPATGKRVQFSGLIFDDVVDDQVVERWEQWNQMAMLQQIGAVH